MKKRFKILQLLKTSPLARKILRDSKPVLMSLDYENRKIWPVAKVARFFGVSERLLWNWIKQGLLRTRKPAPFQKRGIAAKAVKRFVNQLREAGKFFDDGGSFIPAPCGRPDEAMQKIRGARLGGDGLIPREFAARASVSRTSVMRAIHRGVLRAWNPTPRRYVTGGRANYKKKKKIP